MGVRAAAVTMVMPKCMQESRKCADLAANLGRPDAPSCFVQHRERCNSVVDNDERQRYVATQCRFRRCQRGDHPNIIIGMST